MDKTVHAWDVEQILPEAWGGWLAELDDFAEDLQSIADESTDHVIKPETNKGGRAKGSGRNGNEIAERFEQEHFNTGISQAKFARREDIPPGTLSGYIAAYRSENRSENP
jgi:hypothetical protein